ncbi:MAG: ATP-binding cassette domain-containing protein [Lachnospiraceae bacterium]|nr:ATP-binding cassette domain-containing protein [Lachnospiraceae bacterium]
MKKEKKDQKKKYSKLGSLVWAMKKLAQIDKNFVFFIFATVPVVVISPLVKSLFSKTLIDEIGAGKSFRNLVITVAVFIGTIFVLDLLQKYIYSRCKARRYYPTTIYQNDMSRFQNYETDFENTEKQDFKELCGYAWGDACHGNCAMEYLWEDLSNALINLLGIITFVSFLLVLNPLVFAVIGVTSVLAYITTSWQPKYFEKHKKEWEKEERKKNYLQGLSDDFYNAKDIKLYGMESWLDKMMRDYQAYLLMWNKRCSLRGFFASVLAGLMSFIQNGVVYVVLIGMLLEGEISVGDFVFFFGLASGIAGYLQGIITDVAKLGVRADKIAYFRDFFGYESRFNRGQGCALPEGPVKIELKDVWYKYDGAEDYTLKGVNLTIEGSESLALVGVNGAGKTTLIKLICGMYTPTKGDILVNGRHISDYNVKAYYSMISAVFQEIRTAAFTIFEFVASADMERETAREDAVAAMKAAGIWEKIASLSNGMDTHLQKGIYDDGVDLSGGELQKLVLARAIYKNGSILVLDEPTAALDPIAENNLYLKYRELTQGKTSIYISHRFASTRFCDRIVLLGDGVIQESGSHEELMESNGQYAYMFGVQSKYYKEGEIHA